MQQLEYLGLMNRDSIIIRKIAQQTAQGDVQIVANVKLTDYLYIFENPTSESFYNSR